MKVNIEKRLYLESDDMQFILKNYTGKVDKDGREHYQTLGYFTSLESALERIIKMKIMESNALTLSALRDDVIRIKRWIHTLFEL